MSSARANGVCGVWQVSREPRREYARWVQSHRCCFAQPRWAPVLTALGAQPFFLWNGRRGVGVVVPVFRRFGLRIGFLGFPVAGADFDTFDIAVLTDAARAVVAVAQLDVVRVSQSQRAQPDGHAVAARPEAWINNLQHWQADDNKRLRKDLAFARRAAPGLRLVEQGFDARDCFELYAAAVARHAGRRRYTPAYFAAIQRFAQESADCIFLAAMEGAVLKGFAVAALHGGVGYYLHAAVGPDARREGVSDLLLEHLVRWARNTGAMTFSLMASPWEQRGLLRFKQKWGGAVGLSVTYDFPGGLLGRAAVLGSRWQRRHDLRDARLFAAHDR